MKQEIKSLLEKMEFKESKEKPGLFHKPISEIEVGYSGVTAFIDFRRNEKGQLFYTIEGQDILRLDDADSILSLATFKEQRDKIYNDKTPEKKEIEQAIVTPPIKKSNSLACFSGELTVETIIKYINPDATEQEAFMFLQLCQSRKLNPFLNEAYLVKYGKGSKASFVVGKDAFTKRADQQNDYKGFHAGIIVENKGEIIRREGTFMMKDEILLGGWAKVIRDNHEPYFEEVALKEYIKLRDGKPMSSWASMPGTMIRKVALVHALREAYPQEFSGMYDGSESAGEEK